MADNPTTCVALAEVKYVQTALNTGLQPLETLKRRGRKGQTGQDMAEGLERKWTAAMNATQRKEARTLQENADAANEVEDVARASGRVQLPSPRCRPRFPAGSRISSRN